MDFIFTRIADQLEVLAQATGGASYWILVSLFIAGLVVSAKRLLNVLEVLGLHFGLSALILGIISGILTSVPETSSSISAVLQRHSEMLFPNVICSNIFNICCVLAGGTIIARIRRTNLATEEDLTDGHIFFMVLTAFMLGYFLSDDVFTYLEAFLSVCLSLVYILFCHKTQKKKMCVRLPFSQLILNVCFLILCVLGIKYSGDGAVWSLTKISVYYNLETSSLAGSVLSFGTSLPEMVTVYVSVWHLKTSLAIGNIIGSNIFNISFIPGLARLFGDIDVSFNNADEITWLLIGVTVLFAFSLADNKFSLKEGLAFFVPLVYLFTVLY